VEKRSLVVSKVFAVSILALGLTAIAAPSYAEYVPVTSGPRIVNVSYSDLNVRTEDGGQALLDRIQLAAETVCGPAPSSIDGQATYTYNTCILVAVDSAVAQVGDVLFADAHDSSVAVR
jgi:UrcA family protein